MNHVYISNVNCFYYKADETSQTAVRTVEIRDGKIAAIHDQEPTYPAGATVINGDGLELLPGGIDPHVHFSYVQGNKAISADSFKTGSLAAISGGTTTFMDFVEPRQGETPAQTIQRRLDTVKENGVYSDFAFHFSICTPEQASLVAEAGKIEKSFKIYTVYNGIKIDSCKDLFSVFKEIAKVGAVAMVHCENDQVIQGVPKAHDIREMADVRPEFNELEATTRVLALAELAGCSAHIAHVSLPDQVRIINIYAQRCAPTKMTCEITGHHLLLNSGLYQTHRHWEDLVMSPPLQREERVQELQELLVQDCIQMTCSDHCPFTRAQRNGDFHPRQEHHTFVPRKFFEMPGGTNGVQPRFLAAYSVLRSRGAPLEQICRQTSQNAADRYCLHGKGRIAVGFDADLVLVDPNGETVFSSAIMKETADSTLFE